MALFIGSIMEMKTISVELWEYKLEFFHFHSFSGGLVDVAGQERPRMETLVPLGADGPGGVPPLILLHLSLPAGIQVSS